MKKEVIKYVEVKKPVEVIREVEVETFVEKEIFVPAKPVLKDSKEIALSTRNLLPAKKTQTDFKYF